MLTSENNIEHGILTPEQRLRVFISSTLHELAMERRAARQAIEQLHLVPVMFEAGSRPHPPRSLYQAYLAQSHIFIGIYGRSYGWVAPDMDVSGLEDEYRLSLGKPSLVYVKTADRREPRMDELLGRIEAEGRTCYRFFGSPDELAELVADDLALLLTERFQDTTERRSSRLGSLSPRTLPAPPTPIIGRDEEIAEISRILGRENTRLVTLTGTGGVGKTRLGLAAASAMAGSFTDGVYFVDLASLSDPEEVPAEVASAIGMTQERARDLADTVIEVLSPASVLLLFDNFEHLTAAAPFVASLLAGCPQVKAIVTSRFPLHLRGEHRFPVSPLALPPEEPTLEEIVASPAVGLFKARAKGARPDFTITRESAPAVAEICARLDGLPLAIELAAPAVRMLSPPELATRVRQGLVSFTGDVDLPERQRTLQAAIDWSHGLLDEHQQRMFAWLSVFEGGFTLEAAEGVCCDPAEPDVLECLASLIDASLVAIEQDIAGQTRFRLLETIRAYAAERFRQLDDAEEILDRHTRFFVDFCRSEGHEIRTVHHRTSLLRVMADWPNITAVLNRAIECRNAVAAAAFYHIWIHSWITCESAPIPWWDWVHEAVADRDQTLALPSPTQIRELIANHHPEAYSEIQENRPGSADAVLELPDHVRARFLFCLGGAWAEMPHVDLTYSNRALSQAAALFERLGDITGQADAENMLGAGLGGRASSQSESRERLEHALELYQESADLWGTAFALSGLGALESIRGELAPADGLLRRAVETARSIGSDHLAGTALAELGMVALASGDLEVARTTLSEAAELLLGIYNREGLADCLGYFAALRLRVGDPREAAVYIGAAHAIREQTGFFMSAKTNPAFERIHSDTRRALGDEAFDNAFAEGVKLRVREAVARALELLEP